MPKILVLDDEAAVRNVVGMLLAQAGYDVMLAGYGQAGYRKAQSDEPDLIPLDLMMPVIDGFEVLRRLKENPKTCCIPVVMLTAKIDAASERECMNFGAVDYIKKPWGPRELEDRIGMALGFPHTEPTSRFGSGRIVRGRPRRLRGPPRLGPDSGVIARSGYRRCRTKEF